jgi:hypothetical protein
VSLFHCPRAVGALDFDPKPTSDAVFTEFGVAPARLVFCLGAVHSV